ncbi:type VII secretion protein EssC [Bacillus alkalicellulosilyticus]|uniref:type VII secretion protein EssC n=1 Tax=Alkalihalobacterium alkalicellulosilyticum TaxID=1912214 RepID=UPI0009966938|nr:type VII secretion protein EssC [Bacillus alkalicellulosilyticus]
MLLSLFKGSIVYDCVLPTKVQGQFWVTHKGKNEYEEKIICVEGVEGKWLLKSNRKAYILDEQNNKIKEKHIEETEVYRIYIPRSNETVLLYADPITHDRKKYTKFILPSTCELLIGRSERCDISFQNKYVSSNHATLRCSDNQIYLKNISQSNGTYINGERLAEKKLKPGDVITIIGLKIIVGQGFIALNNPDGKVTINQTVLKPFMQQEVEFVEEELELLEENDSVMNTFYRSPRFKRDIERREIKVDPPPALGNMEETPLMLMIGPSITMALASLVIGVFTIQYALSNNGNLMFAIPTLMMSVSMLIGSVLFPILTRKYERKKRVEKEKLRQEKYSKYLKDMGEVIKQECIHQSEILHENFVTVGECVNRIKETSSKLWERTREQNDFLALRLGLGNRPLEADIRYPEKRFSLEDDNLQEELYQLAQSPKELVQVPITLSLVQKTINGIVGNRSRGIDVAKNLIIQIASLHSYDEVKMVFLYDKKEQDVWNFVKWFPHVWDKESGIRFIATKPSEIKELSVYLERELAKRETLSDGQNIGEISPYFVIFALDKKLLEKAEIIRSLYKKKVNYGFSIIHLYDQVIDLPIQCTMVLDLGQKVTKLFDKNDISGKYTAVQPEGYLKGDEEKLAIKLANTQLITSDSAYILPNMLTFLEMFEVGKIEHLNALTRWKENDPTINLETRIGVNTSGGWFNLDLHERFHGPHGLVAGMTGSGKSEFIMTFILSLAVNFHPHEVAFILIDYKGGGMAHTFTNLPHLAGTITNLDGAAVNRSLLSIQSELKRRQALFNEASKAIEVSNIDIYKYQKLYRERKVQEPVQHLFIISDEFAELKTQQPEFMEQLVSAARIGRSLGVHLILATQKPSGVVDDQIWSNSKFRISLKVQEKADSMDVIKRPDAAELSVTGRFYLQVGFNELFELGQSSWAGAPYYPSDRVESIQDDGVTIIDTLGRIVKDVRIDKRKGTNPPKQIDEVTKYLATIAQEEKISIKKIWLDPIPAKIYINDLKQKYNSSSKQRGIINPIIGEVDDPTNQKQMELSFPLTSEGNAIIYGSAGNGKTTFLTTLLYSVMESHTPDEVHFYVLDFSAETLRAFAKAPHVGDVLFSSDAEKIDNLFKMLDSEIMNRKKKFADYGGDYHSYLRGTNEQIPVVVVVVHNYSAFTETYEDKEEAISYLTREGLKYGIYFIVTALNTGAVRFRIQQNFKQMYVLQLNDETDYSTILGNVYGLYPSKHKGRGLFKLDKIYEFQIAHVTATEENVFDYIRTYCEEYAAIWTHESAKKIPVLPERVDINYLKEEIVNQNPMQIPVGVEKNSLEIAYYDFYRSYINMVLLDSFDNAHFIQGLAEVTHLQDKIDVLVFDPLAMFARGPSTYQYQYGDKDAQLERQVVQLFSTLVERNNTYKDALEQGIEPPTFDRLICIIHSLTGLLSRLTEDSKDKIRVLLEKGEVEYNVTVIMVERAEDISGYSLEPWFKKNVSLSDGIWVGNGIGDYQFKLKIKANNTIYQDIGEDSGYVMEKGRLTLVKLLSPSLTPIQDTVEV